MRSHLLHIAHLSGGHDIKSCPWHLLRREHVRSIIELLSELDKAPATINTSLSAMKGVAREAWVAGRMDSESYQQINDLKSVRGSRLPKGIHLDDVTIRALCSACETDETPKGERDAVLLHLLVNTGLRRSESVSIDLEMIDRGRQSIRIVGKGNKERLVFMPKDTFLRVTAWQSKLGRDTGPLFTRVRRHGVITDHRITDQAVYFIIKERAAQAGVEECAPHDFRRTFATNMLDRGIDVLTVQYALGHTNLATTQRYDRSAERRLEEAMKGI
ncbi:Site-specific recombinase XerD [Modicisalibacter xianhensis]|uniref:Site-specific recombinase XerD n=2 Tax=Modicisalibacter xianhensis TaxID=442341 RepID=A0A1I3EQW1_9GAMM|nr:Site-specific recombinase XerD [Halomonas xianhensis]